MYSKIDVWFEISNTVPFVTKPDGELCTRLDQFFLSPDTSKTAVWFMFGFVFGFVLKPQDAMQLFVYAATVGGNA